MSTTAIGNALKTILEGLNDFSVVYNYPEDELAQYPAAVIYYKGQGDSFHDLQANRRVIQFGIMIFIRNDSPEDAEESLRTVTDNVINALESNVTLNETCDWASPVSATVTPVEREIPVRVNEITVNAMCRVSR